jgi:hypothetical protein
MLIESLPAACTGLELIEWVTPERSVVVAMACEAVVKNFRLGVCERKGLLVSMGSLAGFMAKGFVSLELCCP